MKKGSHKNQIIITTLALLLAVVGYISYDNRDTFMNAKDVLSTEIEAVNGKADTRSLRNVRIHRHQMRLRLRQTRQRKY